MIENALEAQTAQKCSTLHKKLSLEATDANTTEM